MEYENAPITESKKLSLKILKTLTNMKLYKTGCKSRCSDHTTTMHLCLLATQIHHNITLISRRKVYVYQSLMTPKCNDKKKKI